MNKKIVDEFIKYAKEQFGYDIVLRKEDEPDSFENIFGSSFLSQNIISNGVETFSSDFQYQNNFENVCFGLPSEKEFELDYIDLAA